MDKLLCAVGMSLIVIFMKLRNGLDYVINMIQGTDGFLFMMGVCICVLFCAGLMMILDRRKTTQQ